MGQKQKPSRRGIRSKQSLSSNNYNTERNCLVILVVGKREFHVNKKILAYQSTYFNDLFYGNYNEKNKRRIELKYVLATPFRRIMDFMHYGEITDAVGLIVQKPANNDFHMPPNSAAKHIRDFWKNCNELLKLAEMYDINEPFKEYLSQVFSHWTCKIKMLCCVCLTPRMFCFDKNIQCETGNKLQREDTYYSGAAKEWIEQAKKAGISDEQLDRIKIKAKKLHLI